MTVRSRAPPARMTAETAAPIRCFSRLSRPTGQRSTLMRRMRSAITPICLIAYFPHDVSQQWNWQGERQGEGLGLAMSSLETALLEHPGTKVMIANGRYDLVTPYLASRWLVDQLAVPATLRQAIRLRVYEGGHMMYMRPHSRSALARDAADLYAAPAAGAALAIRASLTSAGGSSSPARRARAQLCAFAGSPRCERFSTRDAGRVERLFFERGSGGEVGPFCRCWREPASPIAKSKRRSSRGSPAPCCMAASSRSPARARSSPSIPTAAPAMGAGRQTAADPRRHRQPAQSRRDRPHRRLFRDRADVLADRPEQALPSDASYRVAEGGLEYLSLYRAPPPGRLDRLRPAYRVVGTALGRRCPPRGAPAAIRRADFRQRGDRVSTPPRSPPATRSWRYRAAAGCSRLTWLRRRRS